MHAVKFTINYVQGPRSIGVARIFEPGYRPISSLWHDGGLAFRQGLKVSNPKAIGPRDYKIAVAVAIAVHRHCMDGAATFSVRQFDDPPVGRNHDPHFGLARSNHIEPPIAICIQCGDAEDGLGQRKCMTDERGSGGRRAIQPTKHECHQEREKQW